jgi:hypothetical protein
MAQASVLLPRIGAAGWRPLQEGADQALLPEIEGTTAARSLWADTAATSALLATGANVATIQVGVAATTVTIPGNLTVNGTTTTLNTTNLVVNDALIYANDGGLDPSFTGIAWDQGAALDVIQVYNPTDNRVEIGRFDTVGGTTVPAAALTTLEDVRHGTLLLPAGAGVTGDASLNIRASGAGDLNLLTGASTKWTVENAGTLVTPTNNNIGEVTQANSPTSIYAATSVVVGTTVSITTAAITGSAALAIDTAAAMTLGGGTATSLLLGRTGVSTGVLDSLGVGNGGSVAAVEGGFEFGDGTGRVRWNPAQAFSVYFDSAANERLSYTPGGGFNLTDVTSGNGLQWLSGGLNTLILHATAAGGPRIRLDAATGYMRVGDDAGAAAARGDLSTGDTTNAMGYVAATNTLSLTPPAGANSSTIVMGDTSARGAVTLNTEGNGGAGLHAFQITGSPGTGAGEGTDIEVTAGAGSTTGSGGDLIYTAGAGGATANGGDVTMGAGPGGVTSGDGGNILIFGGAPFEGNGGSVTLLGESGFGTDRDGGDVSLLAGAPTGSGTGGAVNLGSSSIPRWSITAAGHYQTFTGQVLDIGEATQTNSPRTVYAATSMVIGTTVTITSSAVTGSTALTLASTGANDLSLTAQGTTYNFSASGAALTTTATDIVGAINEVAAAAGAGTLAATLAVGNVTGGTDLQVTAGDSIDSAAAGLIRVGETNATGLEVGREAATFTIQGRNATTGGTRGATVAIEAGDGTATTGGDVLIDAGVGGQNVGAAGGSVIINGGLSSQFASVNSPGARVTVGGGADGSGFAGNLTLQAGGTELLAGSPERGGDVTMRSGSTVGGNERGGNMTLRAGHSTAATGIAGTVSITGGEQQSGASALASGSVTITGGAKTNGTGDGGAAALAGGASAGGTGGVASVTGGGNTATGDGGGVTLTGGAPTEGSGGGITITAANGVGTDQQGGAVTIASGDSTGTANGGDLDVAAGGGGATGPGGDVNLVGGPGGGTSGDAGTVTLTGGAPTDGNGGDITITGSAGVGTDRDGGDVSLVAGARTGTGAQGRVLFTSGETSYPLTAAGAGPALVTTAQTIIEAINESAMGGMAGALTETLTNANAGTMTIGQVVYLTATDDEVDLANGTTNNALSNAIAFVSDATILTTASGGFITGGTATVRLVSGLTVNSGEVIYLSTTAGECTNVAPATTGNVVLPLGIIKNVLTYDGGADRLVSMIVQRGNRSVAP